MPSITLERACVSVSEGGWGGVYSGGCGLRYCGGLRRGREEENSSALGSAAIRLFSRSLPLLALAHQEISRPPTLNISLPLAL